MKKILLITAIAFIIVSILTIMFTIQASNTFINFSGDNGDNGDENTTFSNLNLIQDNYIDNIEDSCVTIKDQNFTTKLRNKPLDSDFSSFSIKKTCLENRNIHNKRD